MSIALTKDELCSIVGGTSAPAPEKVRFHGAEFDSREIKGGELFIALKGEKTHGHDFLQTAFSRGAALALIEDAALATKVDEPWRLIVVPNTLHAFWALATWWRRQLKIPLVAITGSVGKTTVKEITAAILLRHSRGTYSLKSHNNHVGVPYTICRIASDHAWAVIEMGMNHPGEIATLTKIAEPNVAVITKIAPAHIENLGSVEGIARAKLEITEGLMSGGCLILNGDDQVLGSEFQKLAKKPEVVRSFSQHDASANAYVSKVKGESLLGITFSLSIRESVHQVEMTVVGAHNAMNAAAAALAAQALLPNLSDAQLAEGLKAFKAPLMRLNTCELSKGRKLIDDSYNANPESMKALLAIAKELKEDGAKVGLLLGDMLELGEFAERYHREIGEATAALSPSFLIAVGTNSKYYADATEAKGIKTFRADNATTAGHIATKLDFDILLIKASRGVGLDKAALIVSERLSQ